MIKLLYKTKSISSFKFISNYKMINGIKKIGHTGTLDPLAIGLLLVATDDDTKLIEYIKANDKEYIATGKFGILTSSLDLGSEVVERQKFNITKEELLNTISTFIGEQYQTPPKVSAKKIGGERAYKLLREGEEVLLNPVKISIKKIELLDYNGETFKIRTIVSKGTYIRQLICDIAKKLNTIAIITDLERTMISGLTQFDLNSTINIKDILTINTYEINKISHQEIKDLLNGKPISKTFNQKTLLIYQNKSIAIIKENKPIKVFANNLKYFL